MLSSGGFKTQFKILKSCVKIQLSLKKNIIPLINEIKFCLKDKQRGPKQVVKYQLIEMYLGVYELSEDG